MCCRVSFNAFDINFATTRGILVRAFEATTDNPTTDNPVAAEVHVCIYIFQVFTLDFALG